MPSVNQVLKAGAWQLLTLAIMIVLRYGTIFVIAAFIGPSEWALAAMAAIVVNLANAFSDAGFGPALVQRPEITTLHKRVAMTGSILLGLTMVTGMWLAAPSIARFYEKPELTPVLHWISLVLIIQSVGLVSTALLRRELRFKHLTLIELFSSSVSYALPGITLAVLGFGCYAYIYATLAYTATYAALSFVCAMHNPLPSLHWKTLKELGRFSTGITASRAANFAGLNIDKLILSKMLSDIQFGLYDMAFRIMLIPVKNVGKFADDYVFAMLCRLKTLPEKRAGFVTAINLTSLVALPLTVFLVAISQDLVDAILSAQWSATGPVLMIMMIGLNFRLFIRISDASVRALGAVFRGARNNLFYLVLVVVACSAAGYFESLQMACWGVVAASAVTSLTILLLNARLLSVSLRQLGRYLCTGIPVAVLTAISCGGANWLQHYLETTASINLAMSAGITALVTGLVTWVYPGILGRENSQTLAMVVQQIAKSQPKLQPWIARLFSNFSTNTTC